jgi:hypothetical protein
MSDEVTIAIGPVLVDSGFADGEFLRVEQESDATEDVAGTDGEVAVSRTNDYRATITVLLLQTADANLGLSVLANLARSSPGMAGAIVPSLVRDRNGASLYTAENSWVQRPPDASFDRTAQSREWAVRCARLIRVDGGN